MSGLLNATWPRPVILARLAALPTVWSNCLAAAWLAQGSPVERWSDFFRALDWPRFLLVLAGTSLVFIGWTVARENSRDDAEAHAPLPRLPRPGWWLLAGSLLIALAGRTPAMLAVTLLAVVSGELLLDRNSVVAPMLRGLARVAVYLAAAATLPGGVNGWPVWGGVVMAAFVAGVSFVIRQQDLRQPLEPTPLLLLAAPLVLAWVMNNGPYRAPALLLGLVLVLWLARSLQPLFRQTNPAAAPAELTLLPAIVLVDWLAIADAPRTSGFLFIPLFLLAVTLPRLSRRTAAV